MPTPTQDNIEFGWNGQDGYVKNNGKYNLLYDKPVFSFGYDSAVYTSDTDIKDLVIGQDGLPLDLSEQQKDEIEQFIKIKAVNEPWSPPDTKNYVIGVDSNTNVDGDVFILSDYADGSQRESATPLIKGITPEVLEMDGDLLKVTTKNGAVYKLKVQAPLDNLVQDVSVTADERLKVSFKDGSSKTYALPSGGGGDTSGITVESGSDIHVGVQTLNLTNMKVTDGGGTTLSLSPQLQLGTLGGQMSKFDSVRFGPSFQIQTMSQEQGVANVLIDPKAFAERDNHGYFAAPNDDIRLLGSTAKDTFRKEVLWFDQTIVSSMFIQIDRNGKAIGIQEDDGLDPNITDGTYFFIGLYLDSDTVVLDDVKMSVRLVNKTTKQPMLDYKGKPCEFSGTIAKRQKVGTGAGFWIVRATALTEFQVEVEHNSTIGLTFLRRGNGLSCLCVQSMTTAKATGAALTQFQFETRHLYYFSSKRYSRAVSMAYSAVGSFINLSLSSGDFQIMSDGWFLTTKANTGVIIGTDNHIDVTANTLGHWDIHKVLSVDDTSALLGKDVTIGGTLTDKDDAYFIEILSYNGDTAWDTTKPIVVDVLNGNPTYASGWTKVGSGLFFSEDITQGDHSLIAKQTLPAASVKNLAIMIRPVSPQLPSSVRIKDVYMDVDTPFTTASIQVKKFSDIPDVDLAIN